MSAHKQNTRVRAQSLTNLKNGPCLPFTMRAWCTTTSPTVLLSMQANDYSRVVLLNTYTPLRLARSAPGTLLAMRLSFVHDAAQPCL